MAVSALSDARVTQVRTFIWLGLVACLICWLAAVPLFSKGVSFFFYLMLWITMASAFNIICGFAGYLPFGYVAFYGVGAYVTAVLVRKVGWPVYAAIPLSGVAGVLLSLIFAKTLKLSGIYFAIVSLALGIICQLVVANLPEEITGGSFGINLGGSPDPLDSFYTMLFLMVATLATVTWVAHSRLGTALKAIRDDSEAADALGVNVPRMRLYAWMLAALFPSLCGGIEAWYTNVVDTTTAFDTLVTAKTVIYATMGGLGTISGPVVGTVVMLWIDDLIWQRFPVLNLFLLGFAVVLLIQFMPRGIVGTLLRRKPRLRRYLM
ncbi:MAG: branched-chain amino acid ABC transporter permease [Nevskiales bacterium]